MFDFRFAANIHGLGAAAEFSEPCRHIESLGYDALFAADHLGIPSPFPILVAAAQATEHLRVGTLVLNSSFWNPALLARDIATTDLLTGGRLEVGIGAGHMKWEFDEAGIDWQPLGSRVREMRETIDELARLFASHSYEQQAELRAEHDIPVLQPVQNHGFGGTGPPLIVGGTGDQVLRHVAETADIVNLAGIRQVNGQPPGTLQPATAAGIEERVHFTRTCAGERADEIEWATLLQMVVPAVDREAAAEDLRSRLGDSLHRADPGDAHPPDRHRRRNGRPADAQPRTLRIHQLHGPRHVRGQLRPGPRPGARARRVGLSFS